MDLVEQKVTNKILLSFFPDLGIEGIT